MKRNQKPGLYPGRRIHFSVADGYAEYEIETIRPAEAPDFVGEAVVNLVPDGCGYEFEGAYLNFRGELVLPLPVAERCAMWADRMDSMVRG